jgi:Fe2+ or Zn2+ uptake regulation protein
MTPDATGVEERADLLRRHDLKVTPQRLAILEVLVEAEDTHPTAEEVHAALQATHPTVSLSTVYDTLSRFEELEIVDTFHVGDGATRYEWANEPHVNVVCVDCREVVDVDTPKVTDLVDDVEDRSKFSLAEQPVELRGRCSACA